MTDAFSRYAKLTNLKALIEFSGKPLRKCVRVNTLKMSVEEFKAYAKAQGWQLEPVPWCSEGFFIDRPSTRLRTTRRGLGKDHRHLLGHFYVQEASSMLPVVLLDPQPGEYVLDMAAAPGSKSTQIAALMQGQGVLVANDMNPIRLRTLTDALQRSGVTNALVQRHKGQWYGVNMTGRFHKVLIDAPCTAEGTVRKDPDALKYNSSSSIAQAASLQKKLLEAAIHATRIGGTVVYSTCTLAPEENEAVVAWALKKYEGKVEVVDPMKMKNERLKMKAAIADSKIVQKSLRNHFSSFTINFSFLRIWPQTYNTEGFFCAVLKKTAATHPLEEVKFIPRRAQIMPLGRRDEIVHWCKQTFGQPLVAKEERLYELHDQIFLSTAELDKFKIPAEELTLGVPFGKRLRDGSIKFDHHFVTLRGHLATKQVLELKDQLTDYLSGRDITVDAGLKGVLMLQHQGYCLGLGKAIKGKLKNQLPRWLVKQSV